MINERKSQFSTDSLSKRTERPKTLTPTEEQNGSCESKSGTFRSQFAQSFQHFPPFNDDDGECFASSLDAVRKFP